MSAPLYTTEILRLATSIPHIGRLPDAHASAERRSPVCGSRVTVDVVLDDGGRVAAFAQDVKACALGQASASVMGRHLAGRAADEIEQARDALSAYLSGNRDDPGDWPGLAVFAAARDYPARHAAIRLAFEAAAEAARRAAG
jgi:NifU-like protein involved in Fe-S cluster formation